MKVDASSQHSPPPCRVDRLGGQLLANVERRDAKLFVNSMEEKLKSVNVVMDSGAFQAFRAGAPTPNVLPFPKRAVDEGSSLPSPSKVARTETIATRTI